MSEIKTKEKLVGQLSAVTLNATAIVPEWLQPIVKENGVYVGKDAKLYPCFDSEDYASEDRFFWNIVFARSKEELDRKLVELKSISPQTNYNKFSETLDPMIYWGGDSIYDVIATEDIEQIVSCPMQ